MNALYLAGAVALLLTIILGLAHVVRQPGRADSLLAALLLGTTGAALVLLLGRGLGLDRALDIALVFALLAAVLGVAFVLRGWPEDDTADPSAPARGADLPAAQGVSRVESRGTRGQAHRQLSSLAPRPSAPQPESAAVAADQGDAGLLSPDSAFNA